MVAVGRRWRLDLPRSLRGRGHSGSLAYYKESEENSGWPSYSTRPNLPRLTQEEAGKYGCGNLRGRWSRRCGAWGSQCGEPCSPAYSSASPAAVPALAVDGAVDTLLELPRHLLHPWSSTCTVQPTGRGVRSLVPLLNMRHGTCSIRTTRMLQSPREQHNIVGKVQSRFTVFCRRP